MVASGIPCMVLSTSLGERGHESPLQDIADDGRWAIYYACLMGFGELPDLLDRLRWGRNVFEIVSIMRCPNSYNTGGKRKI